jgi:hypothetical protein
MEILSSPNSKSLGANFLMDAYILDMRTYFGHAHIFWTCAYILDMRIYFGHAHIFWTCAYILSKRLHFEQAPIFLVCANILGKRQYFDNFCLIILLDFVIFSIHLCSFCAPIFLAQLF